MDLALLCRLENVLQMSEFFLLLFYHSTLHKKSQTYINLELLIITDTDEHVFVLI
jgi:hypothetical protein